MMHCSLPTRPKVSLGRAPHHHPPVQHMGPSSTRPQGRDPVGVQGRRGNGSSLLRSTARADGAPKTQHPRSQSASHVSTHDCYLPQSQYHHLHLKSLPWRPESTRGDILMATPPPSSTSCDHLRHQQGEGERGGSLRFP
jgi:hypothetical protein